MTGYQKLEVRTATYGPEIDQSQHAKSVSNIIISVTSPVSFKKDFLTHSNIKLKI